MAISIATTSSGQEWQFHIDTSSGQEWQFFYCYIVVILMNTTFLLTSSGQE